MTVRINGTDHDLTLRPGRFLYSSRGYDMSNAVFYKVIRRTPKMVTLVEVEATRFEDSERLAPTDVEVLEHRNADCAIDWDAFTEYAEHQRTWSEHSNEKDAGCWKAKHLRRKIHSNTKHGVYQESVAISSFQGAWPYVGGGVYDTQAAGLPGH